MKCVITGSAGFIGSHLLKALKNAGHEVIGLDNFSNPSFITKETKYGDVRFPETLQEHILWADIVFHLAADISVDRSIFFPKTTMDINLGGTLNVLELCLKYNKRIIFASSSEIYGTAQTDTISEIHPLDVQSPYGASKVAADRLCKAYYDMHKLPVTIVRNFNTFGTYQRDDSYGGVIAKFTKAALANEPLCIFGDGTQQRDYMYVDDAVQAYMLCLYDNSTIGQAINFGSGTTVTVNQIAEMIIEITQSQSIIKHIEPRKGEVQKLQADITKAKTFGFNPKTDFKEDLKKYILWKKTS